MKRYPDTMGPGPRPQAAEGADFTPAPPPRRPPLTAPWLYFTCLLTSDTNDWIMSSCVAARAPSLLMGFDWYFSRRETLFFLWIKSKSQCDKCSSARFIGKGLTNKTTHGICYKICLGYRAMQSYIAQARSSIAEVQGFVAPIKNTYARGGQV